MAGARLAAWVERLSWVLIFGGLVVLALGLAARDPDPATGWTLIVAGALAAAGGIVLIWVRSRLGNDRS